jgi:hypothetical protein
VSDEKTRLTWQDEHYSLDGRAGPGRGVRLFSITWHNTKADPDWLMRSDLPGFAAKTWKDDDQDALQARAEVALAQWLAMINGGLPL